MSERRILVAAADGTPLAVAGDGLERGWPSPLARGVRGAVWEVLPGRGAGWAQRPVLDAAGVEVAVVAAKLDLSEQARHRRWLEWTLLGIAADLAAGLRGPVRGPRRCGQTRGRPGCSSPHRGASMRRSRIR